MICPLCNKDTFKENVSLKKGIIKLQKVFTYFCPMCDLRKEFVIEISRENYDSEVEQLDQMKINLIKKQVAGYQNEKPQDNRT